MQALTGLFARQFGTPNYAAHGGFCSVNMAAGMIYTIGGSFWEFGGPDLDRAKLFVMIGTAEDHHSNPLKIAISKFMRDGGRFISINPVRTGYAAIADEWVGIRPGTDGLLHVSEIANHRVKDVRDELKEGQQVLVKVINIDPTGKIRLSRKALLQEEGAVNHENLHKAIAELEKQTKDTGYDIETILSNNLNSFLNI